MGRCLTRGSQPRGAGLLLAGRGARLPSHCSWEVRCSPPDGDGHTPVCSAASEVSSAFARIGSRLCMST
ncbi:hypothetical protein [Ornithinimicrobium kibberense]|uniref:hypothetical protein n=1 Tax=Ornithinimicrobium kibberense TaxID=282060 RepID=UPI0036162D74